MSAAYNVSLTGFRCAPSAGIFYEVKNTDGVCVGLLVDTHLPIYGSIQVDWMDRDVLTMVRAKGKDHWRTMSDARSALAAI